MKTAHSDDTSKSKPKIAGLPVGFLERYSKYWLVKRSADIILSACALIVLSPLMLIIALLVFIDDPHGSPFFHQTRVGRHGVEFELYKFRTMVVNADEILEKIRDQNEADGPAFKMKDDPRITKVGKILRKTSLDELPQLINVIRGDMTIVGPRPPLPSEVAQYSDYHMLRLMVTPGLTCKWQVSHNKNDIPFDKWVAMDLEYIDNRTILSDIKLIFQTIVVMFKMEGR